MRDEIEIVGLEIVNRPNKSNVLVLSYFDMRTRGFIFRGCALFRTPDGAINCLRAGLAGARTADRATSSSLRGSSRCGRNARLMSPEG